MEVLELGTLYMMKRFILGINGVISLNENIKFIVDK